ncbi:MAG: aminotransferase class V-fold PLP-dependent enzyme [Rhodospirillales bacterium]|jgi:D-glucosaminate-6-phosphate ammonia-lyase|nr:aminotransferase class V-fold PLP-dependent enzyme [Rhodospirillales bacterium]
MKESGILERYGLTRVINVSGTMTALGASRVVPEAIEAGAEIQSHFVRIDELQAKASEAIARLTGAEAGFVTACSAAAMSMGVCGCMTGTNLNRIELLPDTGGLPNEVVVQAGHLVNYGAPINQAVRLTGARIVPLGTAALVNFYNLEDSIGEQTAAALFVVSHHVVQEGQIALEEFVSICKARGVPVIVDMASEYNLRSAIELGAELVIYSSHKFMGGPTGGIVAGRKELVRAAYLQNKGLGRHMKIGKEGIIGTIAALEAWERRDHEAAYGREQEYVDHWREALGSVPGLRLETHHDWTDNPIDRLKISVDPVEAALYAWELADRLSAGEPSVQVRDDLIEHGYFFLDPCNLEPGEELIVGRRIAEEVQSARTNGDGHLYSLSDRKRRGIKAALKWPD